MIIKTPDGSTIEFKRGDRPKHLPVKLQINRKSYKVIYSKGLKYNSNSIAGLCVSELQTIFVNLDEGGVDSTLLHECGHAELCESGFRQRPDWTHELEEMLVETFAESITHNFLLKKK